MKHLKMINRQIRAIGTILTDMVMPNIGAFIAWGLLSAIFSNSGWFPNPQINQLVTMMGKYILPILLASTGGRIKGGQRGSLVAAIATLGLICGMKDSALLGAMIIGPVVGWLMRITDTSLRKHVSQGFELLVNNLTAAFLGMVTSLGAYFVLAPIIDWFSQVLETATHWLFVNHLLALMNVVIEPAKVFFLNNAINHGILNPLGTNQAIASGHSILFLLETNPGPGIGLLLAFALFGHHRARKYAGNALIIHALGGIHEVYFPYVLKHPQLLVSVICGGVTGTFTFSMMHVGLRADPSPGSIITILMLTPSGWHNYIGVIAGILSSTLVSFSITAAWLAWIAPKYRHQHVDAQAVSTSNHVIVTGDAGMGSPSMGARILHDKLRRAGHNEFALTSEPINRLKNTTNATIFVRHDYLERVQAIAPDAHAIISINNYLNTPEYDHFVSEQNDLAKALGALE